MARRPDNTRGTLIFQAGKCIEGDYYIIAVYDDPARCTISFCAYELENDCTYTYPCTYSEFDSFFKFNSELMNPSNQDKRFEWVIERLDFVNDERGDKVLCLGEEPTPDDEEVVDSQPKAQGGVPTQAGGTVDAATRAKLLKELDTQDDEKLYRVLVRSEGARKRFLADLHSKRELEQLKAAQRLLRNDEAREERLNKLDFIKKQQAEKAAQAKVKDAAARATQAQLEVLMKQKEAKNIRRLIQEKDEADRGMGREKDAARAKRKMQERSAAAEKAIEEKQAQQLAGKREIQIGKRDQVLLQRNREIAQKVREYKEAVRAVEARRRDEKDEAIAETWRLKADVMHAREVKNQEFFALEQIRDRKNIERDRRRAHQERDYFQSLKEAAQAEAEDVASRRQVAHKDMLVKWRVNAKNTAVDAREQQRRDARRAKACEERAEAKLRKFREAQFLDKTRTMSPTGGMGSVGFEMTALPGDDSEAALQKSQEQEERARRQAARDELRAQFDKKKEKLEQLSGRDPNVQEMLRLRKWREDDDAKKKSLADARMRKEVALEEASKRALDEVLTREETWQSLEAKRRAKSIERAKKLNAKVVKHIKALAPGTGLPAVLTY